MWAHIVIALALMFVIEGVVLAAAPRMTKIAMKDISELPAGTLRVAGIVSMLVGLAILLVSK